MRLAVLCVLCLLPQSPALPLPREAGGHSESQWKQAQVCPCRSDARFSVGVVFLIMYNMGFDRGALPKLGSRSCPSSLTTQTT